MEDSGREGSASIGGQTGPPRNSSGSVRRGRDRKGRKWAPDRAKEACVHCRASHASCSLERPCQRCVDRHLDCVVAPSKSTLTRKRDTPETEMLHFVNPPGSSALADSRGIPRHRSADESLFLFEHREILPGGFFSAPVSSSGHVGALPWFGVGMEPMSVAAPLLPSEAAISTTHEVSADHHQSLDSSSAGFPFLSLDVGTIVDHLNSGHVGPSSQEPRELEGPKL